jgi:hypothetical protein
LVRGGIIEFSLFFILLSALGLGAAHALEIDHMSAVSAFVARRPSPREAVLFGVKWATGHGFSLVLLGSVLYLLKMQLSEPVAGNLERLVGVALVGLGLWTLIQLRPGQLHHSHDGVSKDGGADGTHTHADGTVHSHGHSHERGSLWMGMLHGAAGTAAFVGQAAMAAATSYAMVLAYTLAFSVGVLLAMAAYAGILGGVIDWGGRRARSISIGAQALTGVLACTVGMCWIIGIELPTLLPH